jgi:hypothetical protein
MELESQELTTCKVAEDGRSVSLGFVDRGGKPASINFPIDQIGALAMTLPTLMEKALRTRYQDNSLRYAFPLGSWTCEPASDPTTSIVTLRTPDGFSVCFSAPRQQLSEIGEAMASPAQVAAPLSN